MSNMPKIEADSLAEHLFNHHRLADLQRLIENNSLEPLKQQWQLSDEQCVEQIELAIHYIEHD